MNRVRGVFGVRGARRRRDDRRRLSLEVLESRWVPATAAPGLLPTLVLVPIRERQAAQQLVSLNAFSLHGSLPAITLSYEFQARAGGNRPWFDVGAASAAVGSVTVPLPSSLSSMEFRVKAKIIVDTDFALDDAEEEDGLDDVVDLSASPLSPEQLAAAAPFTQGDFLMTFTSGPVQVAAAGPVNAATSLKVAPIVPHNDLVCVNDIQPVSFDVRLAKGQAPPADKDVKSQTYTLETTQKEGGKFIAIQIGNTIVTRDTPNGPLGFSVEFLNGDTRVVLKKSKKSNPNASFRLQAQIAYASPGDKLVKFKGDVTLTDGTVLGDSTQIPLTAVHLTIDPVTTRSGVYDLQNGRVAPLNVIPNPSAIEILDGPRPRNADKVARIVITAVTPNTVQLTDDDDRLVWNIENVDRDGKPDPAAVRPRADFFAVNGVQDDTGRSVRVLGLREGRVRITATLKGSTMPCVSYEALVVEPREIKFRVQMLSSNSNKSATKFQVAEIQTQIDVANRYLHQVGVRLVPDDDTTVANGARIVTDRAGKDVPGFFRNRVDRKFVESVKGADLDGAVALNHDAKVVNIVFLDSIASGNTPLDALSVNLPGHVPARGVPRQMDSARQIQLVYRAQGDAAPARHPMALLDAKLQADTDIWGMVVSNLRFDSIDRIPRYGIILAHEIGHILNLRHRVRGAATDGLPFPAQNQNLMSGPTGAVEQMAREDLDLIQAYAIGGSPLFD